VAVLVAYVAAALDKPRARRRIHCVAAIRAPAVFSRPTHGARVAANARYAKTSLPAPV